MRIVVCVKQSCKDLNPFDACAVEEALRIEGAEVIALSMGRQDVKDMLLALTRLGVHKGILLSDTAFAGADTLATSYALSLAIKELNPDMVICGRQSIDGDTAQVGPCLATMLGIPVITNVMELKLDGDTVNCKTRLGDKSAKLPALVTVERINNLRFPKIRAKTGEVEVWDINRLGADPERCGLKGSPTKVVRSFENSGGKRKCTFIKKEDLAETIKIALQKPRAEIETTESGEMLESVWAIGEKAAEKAREIAKEVIVLNITDPNELATLAKEKKPEVILFDSSIESRMIAPQVSAMLNTGLCADCTKLETDGKQLFMYRPAFGGNIIAKIKCVTKPQMATVRTVDENTAQLILAGGRGIKGSEDVFFKAAEKLGAQIGASRALVDMGEAKYEHQIGLTGRTVCPNVYIAVGISGAVQHVCGMEQSNVIIAINPDRTAPIFEYADYGIVGEANEVLSELLK